jgi:hypothetical protein
MLTLLEKAKNDKDTGFDARAQAAADKNANEMLSRARDRENRRSEQLEVNGFQRYQ